MHDYYRGQCQQGGPRGGAGYFDCVGAEDGNRQSLWPLRPDNAIASMRLCQCNLNWHFSEYFEYTRVMKLQKCDGLA